MAASIEISVVLKIESWSVSKLQQRSSKIIKENLFHSFFGIWKCQYLGMIFIDFYALDLYKNFSYELDTSFYSISKP